MLRLLVKVAGDGYPGDYLRARLHGRRILRAPRAAATPAVESDDRRYWEEAARERFWLFRQLNGELRSSLAPLFVYFELNTVATVLRFLAGERAGEADRLLQASMLAPGVRAILRGREGVAQVLARLERSPAAAVLPLAGIGDRYAREGLRGSEETLRGCFLEQASAGARQHDLHLLFRDLIDVRNMLVVAKYLRWRPDPAPPLLAGGRVSAPGSAARISAAGLARLVRRWTGSLAPAGEQLRPELLEELLRDHLLRRLTRRRREGGAAAAAIEYLWLGQASARVRSLRLHAGGEAVP